MKKYAIIIVGSGPAGISTALSLIRIAPELADQTLILEKARHPRSKLCGGGLTIDAENLLLLLDLETSNIPHVDAGTAHLEYMGRGLKFRQMRERALRFIRRDQFDAWLVSEARKRGAVIREGVKVTSLQTGRGGVTLETDAGTFEARVVIGADGSTGTIRKYVSNNAFSVTGRALEILVPPNRESPHLPRDAYFEFSPVTRGIAGYMWDFPTQIHGHPARVWGIYDSNLNMETKRSGMKELLAEEMARHGYHLEDYPLEGHPIHLFTPFNRFSSPRLLLVGDAAGADPFFGEGISMALAYGMIAARSLRRAIKRQDYSFRDYPLRLIFSPLGRILTIRWLIANVLFGFSWGWFQFLVWRILKPLVNLVSRFLVINWSH